jgi:hypothetical protein
MTTATRALRPLATLGAAVLGLPAHAQAAASPEILGWLPWIVVAAIALFVVGVVVRMILAARFPKGYRRWARGRRDAFEARNEEWDRADEDFRR